MLNKEKIRLMCELAGYEKKKGSEEMKVLEYYKFDYLMRNSAFSFIRFTFCFLLCLFLYVFFNTTDLFYNINLSGISGTVGRLVLIYIIGLALYLGITWIVYGIRYDQAGDDIDGFVKGLKKLDRRFNGRGRKA